jgi:UDP-N-acetylglucosamine 3-dehydrogenase
MINLAVIGAGYWGTKLIGEYLALSKKRQDVRLLAVADVSPEKLLRVREKFLLSNSMLKKNYNEILNDPKITGVHVATPNETHYEIATKAIAAGKHVLLEKPMCLSSGDAFRLARYAEKNSSVLLIGHIFRFNNAINKVKELVEKKVVNGIRCVELRWASFMPPPPGRDIIFDLAPHPVDILNHIFEEWPTHVYVNAHSYERKKAGLEEVAFAIFNFPEDIIASVIMSWIHHGTRQRTATIVSKKNTIKMEAVEQTITVYENGQTREISIERNNTIESEINHFVDRVKNNDPPINSALTGAMNVTVLEVMRKSLQERRVTPIIGG